MAESYDLFARHRREADEKIVNRLALFKTVEQCLHRNSRSREDRGPAHHIGASGDNGLFHAISMVDRLRRPDGPVNFLPR